MTAIQLTDTKALQLLFLFDQESEAARHRVDQLADTIAAKLGKDGPYRAQQPSMVAGKSRA